MMISWSCMRANEEKLQFMSKEDARYEQEEPIDTASKSLMLKPDRHATPVSTTAETNSFEAASSSSQGSNSACSEHSSAGKQE